jgi:two-component system CheB/CheR fusion protein
VLLHETTSSQKLQEREEELETINEELQAANEELQTTSEELQATNEELRTLNEELQTSNVSLQQLNEDYHKQHEAFTQLLAFTKSVLASLPTGVVVIDTTFRILMWNRQASELWGLESHQAEGASLLHLDIGLPVETLVDRVRALLAGQVTSDVVIVDAIHRLGQRLQCRITCTPLMGEIPDILGAILLMEGETQHGSSPF